MRQMNINKGNYEVKSHYKMYKAGKRWVVAGMATVSLLGGLLMLSTDASADNVDAVVPASESSVTTEVSTPTDSVVLNHASASVAPASSVSAEVSASSANSVAPVSVSTAASVVSAEASLSASQSLASSFVVPADAKKVQDDVDADGNVRKGYVLATAVDTQTPDSAVTPVQTNAAYTSSTEAKSASLPAVSTAGTIAESSYIKTDSAQNHTSFSYKGSLQVNNYFNQTGDITNLSDVDVTNSNFRSGAYSMVGATSQSAYDSSLTSSRNYYSSYYTSYYKSTYPSMSSASMTASVSVAVSSMMSGKPDYDDIPSSVSNAVKTANSVASKVLPSQSKTEDIDWKALVPEVKNEGGTLSYQSQLDVLKGFEIKGGYRLVSIDQTTGAIRAYTTVTGAQAVGVVMAPVQPTVMGTPSISSGHSLNNNDAIATINNAVIAGRDMFVNNAGDVNSLLVHIRTTDNGGNLMGGKNGKGTAGVTDSGYAWADTANGVAVSKTTNTSNQQDMTDGTKSAAQGDMYKGVYFDYKWANPTLNANGTVTATLTYTEYSDSAMTKVIGTVTNSLTVDRYMAVGLYAANGGNGNSFFGGISYFQGTNATSVVNVSYKFGKNEDTLLPDTKINAVVGEKIKITDAKTTLSADTGMTVTYVAPDVPGFKIDPSSTMSAIAGSNDLTIKYVVDQDDFNQQLGKANTALSDIDASIHDLQGMIDADPSSIDVQSVLTKMQDIRKQAAEKIATMKSAADDSVDLTKVADVQDALKKIMQGANDVSALAIDAANQIDLAKEIKKNAVSINKNISDDTDVTKAKDKINDDIASGQLAVDIANDKVDLESKVKIATKNRQDAIAAADKAVADNTVNNALVDGAKSALQVLTGESTPTDDTHTKTEIKAGIDNLTKVSSVDVPANVMNVEDIKDAIANLTDLLTNKPTDTPTIDAALQALKNKVDQAKVAVANSVRDAKSVANEEVPVNVRDQNHTVLDAAKKHLQEVADNVDSTTDDIAKAQQAVTDELTKLTDARDAEIVKGKTVAGIAVPDNATDQTVAIKQLQADQDALTKLMNNGESTLTQIQDAEKLVTADLTEMSDAVSNSKTDANKVVTNWNGKSNLYTDQKDALKTIQDDIDHLNAVVKDGASTVSVINDAKQRLQDDIDTVTDARNGSVSAGNSLVDGLTDQQKKDALVDASVTELNKAINDGTKSAIDTAVEKVKTAVDTMINEDINDVPAVVTAKQKIVDLLKGDTVDATAVKNATDELKTVANQASDDLKAKKSAAATAEIPANLKDQFNKLDAATQKTLTDEVAGLATAAAKDGVKVSELQPKLDQLQTDLADMQKNLQNAKNAAQAVANAKAPANVADQAGAGSVYETAKTVLDEALKNKNATASDLETVQTAVTEALQDMQTNVTTAKENANKVADSWTDEANMFTDQNTSAVKQALNDLAGLSDDATQADYERVKTELSTAKKAVEKVRDDAVKAGNTVADGVSEAQKKDDLVHTSLGELTKAISTGTASEIMTAADKVGNAVKAIVDVPVADVPAVVSAKQKVVDLLNDKQLDDKKIADAIGELKDALKQATADLQTAKKNATVEEPGNLHDQIEKLSKDDQGKLATTVSNLKNLVNPENDGTTKASDIKAQQDVVDGILNKLKANRDAEIAKGKNVAGTAVPDNATDQTATIKQLQADQAALTALMNNEDSTLTQIQVAEKAVTDDLKKMSDAVSSSKGDANKVVTDWNGKANLYTDQKNALETIQGDLDHLDMILKDDASTVSEINEARTQLQTDIKKVTDTRDSSVSTGNDVVSKVTEQQKKDQLVDTSVNELTKAISGGTKSAIDTAIEKVKTAVDTMIDEDINDVPEVVSAKQKIADLLKGDTVNATAVAEATQTLKDATKQADADLQTAKKNATVAEPENLHDQIEQLSKEEQGQLATSVANLKNLVNPENDGTTKASDIKAQQDVVDGILNKLKANRDAEIAKGKNVAGAAVPDNATDQTVAIKQLQADQDALTALMNNGDSTLTQIQAAEKTVTDDLKKMSDAVSSSKDGANKVVTDWNGKVNLYTDQKNALETIQGHLDHLDVILKDDASTVSEINEASKDLQSTINKVAAVRQKAVDNADAVVVKNGENTDVKERVAAVKDVEKTGTASDIAKAVAKLQTADATVVPTNIADDGDVAAAKVAVNKALNANDYKQADVDTAKDAYDNAVATAQATLKQAVTDANAVKVPANLQDQVEMAKKNKLGDVNQQVTDLHKAAGQDDTTAITLRSAMNDIQGSLDDMKTKLNTTRDAAQKLVDQTADATDTNVVAARKQVTNLLANNDTTTMTDLQNAMNVLTATSKPATANTVETSPATVESDQVSTPVANDDVAFAIVTDANGKQRVVQLDKTENGTATANVPGATDAQVVTVPKNGNKPFIFVTDGSGTTQYTELTPNGAKTTITPDGSTTKVVDGVDVPAGANVDVMYLPTAEVSVQAGAKNVQVPGKTGYTATVTDAQGNEVTLTDGMIAVDGVPAGTNYLVTYTPDPAKVVVKLGTDSGFAKGEEPAAGNTNAQTLMTVQDALNKLQKDNATLASIVSTGYTDTKVNVTNAVEALNRVDQNLNIDGYAHRIQAPDGTQYDSLEDAVKANPTFAAGTTQMKVVYAPLDGQKIQVKDADGNVLGTVMGKSDAEINVDDFKSVDADLQAKAEKGKLKMTVTAPDGKTYDSLMDALQATGYFDHVGLEDGPSSFDQSDAKFVATSWDETGKATAGYMVLGEPATPNDLNIQDFVVSFAPANDGAGHNNTNAGSKTGSSVEDNNQNSDQVNVAGPANGLRDGSEVNNATVAGQTVGAQVAGSQTGATANTAQNAGWQAQGATQNSDNTASLLAAAGNEQQANTANSDDARITEMPDSAAVIQDSILPLETAKQAMNLTGRVTEDNFLVVVAAMVASGLFGLLLAFWRRRKEDDQATH